MADTTSQLSILVRVRDEASAALSRLSSDISELGGNLNFAGDKAGILAGALSAISTTAVVKNAIEAFADAEAKMASFDAIIKTLPPSLQRYRDQILSVANDALMKFGFDNEEAALSLGRLLQATYNAPEAFHAFNTAMDLARAKHLSLEEATQLLIVAFMGGGRILKQYGIDVDSHASKETILAAITQKLAGQAEAYSQTLQGQLGITKGIIHEVFEAIGAQLAPAIELVTGQIIQWIKTQGGINAILEKHATLITVVGGLLLGILLAGFVVATAAALALIGTFGTLLAWFAAIAGGVIFFAALWHFYWDDVRNFFMSVWNGIRDFFASIWNTMLNTVSNAVSSMRGYLQSVVDFYNNVKNTVSQPIQSAVSAASNAGSSLGHLLGFQHGGVITRPTIGLIGEAGPEAIIPLSHLGSTGIGGQVTINLNGDFYTDTESAERWANELARIIKYQLKL